MPNRGEQDYVGHRLHVRRSGPSAGAHYAYRRHLERFRPA